MTRVAVLALLVAALAPAAVARAESAVLPTRSTEIPAPWAPTGWPIAPKLMGKRVAWVDGSRGAVDVWTADVETRRVRRIHRLRDTFGGYFEEQPRLETSPTRLVVSAMVHAAGSLSRFGAPGELRRLELDWVDLDGDRLLVLPRSGDPSRLAIVDPIRGVRDDVTLPDPAPDPPPVPFVRTFKLAGDMLAYHQNSEGGVMEWRTGRVVTRSRTQRLGYVAGLQPDGTALWGEGSPWPPPRGDYTVTTPGAEQRPLPLPRDVVPILARDRVAYHDRARGAIVVADLTGREVAAVALAPDATASDLVPDFAHDPRAPRPALSDFDGRRAVWAYRPCAVAVVAVWDVDAGSVPQPRPRCRAARLAGAIPPQGPGDWRVPLRCAAPRLTGCATRLTLRTRRGRLLARTRVDLAAGARRTVVVPGVASDARRLVVTAAPALRPAPGERRTWRVRTR